MTVVIVGSEAPTLIEGRADDPYWIANVSGETAYYGTSRSVTTGTGTLLTTGSSVLLSSARWWISSKPTAIPAGTRLVQTYVPPDSPVELIEAHDLDADANAAAIDAQAGALHNVYAAEHGVTADGTTDDTEALQDAVDAALALCNAGLSHLTGNVILPPGTIRTSDEIVLPSFPCVSLKGAGTMTTCIQPLSDFGAGKYVLRWDASSLSLLGEITDLRVLGSTNAAWSLANPVAMSGIKVAGGARIHRVHVSDVYAGLEVLNDHNVITESRSGQCYYGIYMGPSTSFGDQYFAVLNLTPNYMANVGVSGAGSLNGAVFEKCHMGASAYAMFKETVTTTPTVMDGGRWDEVSVEGVGNAVFGCETTHEGTISGVKFSGLYVSLAAEYRAAGEPVGYNVDCFSFIGNKFFGGSDRIIEVAPGEQLATFNVAQFFGNDIGLETGTAVGFLNEDIPLVVTGADCSVENRIHWQDGVEALLVRMYTTACTTGQVMQWTRNSLVIPFDDTGGSLLAGVAMQDLASGNWLIVARAGVLTVKHANDPDIATNAATATNYMLVGDTANDGCCKPGTTGSILGVSAVPQTPTTSTVRVRLGGGGL